jgi:serine protease inhibitor
VNKEDRDGSTLISPLSIPTALTMTYQRFHKAVIEVNEEGSKAAAATLVEMKESAAPEPLTFTADRPFVFIITYDETVTILFMGKLYDLKSE